jgi:hypothetical protein
LKTLLLELRKEKRTGVFAFLIIVGILGALYAFVNFAIRGETLLELPLPPMDILLTQLYGMIIVLNMFGIIIASCVIFNIEFQNSAIKKMFTLPISVPGIYLCKFVILTFTLFIAVVIQNIALARIGLGMLPTGSFEMRTLIHFAWYSFITSMPVLSVMLLISSRIQNIWITLGGGVIGFLSGMTLAGMNITTHFSLIHPFAVMFRPAIELSAKPDPIVIIFALSETVIFLIIGLVLSDKLHYE